MMPRCDHLRSHALVLLALIWVVLLSSPAPGQAAQGDGIDWPTNGSTVSGRVEIRGTAGSTGPSFRSYRLEYGPGRAPAIWQPIGPERDDSVDHDVLGVWETSALQPAEYTLRLTVFDEAGHDNESRVTVTVATPLAGPPQATAAPAPTASPAPATTPTSTPEPVEPEPTPADTAEAPAAEIAPTPSPAPTREPPPGPGRAVRCPMVYYHEVPRPAAFAAQLATFLQAGYRPVTMGQLVDALEGRGEPPVGCLVLTFDDGLASQMSGALPVLQNFSVPATFFVMPSFRDGVHRYMSTDDFRTLRDAGMEVGSHTLNHANLPRLLRLNYGALLSELSDSKAWLEQELGQPVNILAYPSGAWDYPTAEAVRRAGYRAAASTMPGSMQRPEDLYWLHRIRADPWEPPETVLARLRGQA
jgi:peptidoglycan/xylan/chitin deacetylase (PgdA/CDA1 family)